MEAYDAQTKGSEAFFEATEVTLASQSILYTPHNDPDSHALLTGVVRKIQGEFNVGTEDDWDADNDINEEDVIVKIAVGLEVLGAIITVIIDKREHPDITRRGVVWYLPVVRQSALAGRSVKDLQQGINVKHFTEKMHTPF